MSSTISSLQVATLGTPRIGPRRELKLALERFWSGASEEKALIEAAVGLRAANWARQKKLGVTVIPTNDFSFYDHVLDTAAMVGAIPEIYGWRGGAVPLATYFAMARGAQGEGHDEACGHAHHAHGVPALEMTKWFDTNYHYMVPELARDQNFTLASRKPIEEYEEAKALGYQTRPVLVGPVTFLKLAKSKHAGFEPLSLLDRLLPVYIDVLRELADRGAEWVQIDEPCLVLDLDSAALQALRHAYVEIARAVPQIKIMLASYFGALGHSRDTAFALPVAGLHLDLVRAPGQIDDIASLPDDRVLSLGVIDGRNVWRADLSQVLDRLAPVVARLGRERVQIAPSCSLLHVPIDLALETFLDSEAKSWLAFAAQKIEELAALGTALAGGRGAAESMLKASDAAAASRKTSPRIHDANVAARAAGIDDAMRAAPAPMPSAPRCSSSASTCRASRPRPSARFRRPRTSGTPAPRMPAAHSAMPPTRHISSIRPRARCAGRRISASTCWCTASSSATTWCSILASSFRASPSPKTAGCSPMARAASGRRFSLATSRVRSR